MHTLTPARRVVDSFPGFARRFIYRRLKLPSIETKGRGAASLPRDYPMQLRVARLCLDCEELHVDNSCPRCASERYAFLSAWLPSEERRRWRRPAPVKTEPETGPAGFMRSVGRWFTGDKPPQPGPATRASDYAAQFKFDSGDDRKEEAAARQRLDVGLSKHDAR